MKSRLFLTITLIISSVLLSSCGNIYIRSPGEDVYHIVTPYDLSVVKRTFLCGYDNNSFRATLDKGTPSETDITSAFNHSPSSDWWTATNYNLPLGEHSLYVSAGFSCWNKSDSDQTTVMVYPPPMFGTGPAGGVVFHVTDGGLHGLEVAPVDQGYATWGCAGTSIPGADGTAVGTGAQNTADILAACSEPGSAAAIANAYTLNGYSDWYLPSKDELNLLMIHQFVVGGFESCSSGRCDYWTSSEVDRDKAWMQHRNRDYSAGTKDRSNRVRPIRAF